jgi:hypothetical protein
MEKIRYKLAKVTQALQKKRERVEKEKIMSVMSEAGGNKTFKSKSALSDN